MKINNNIWIVLIASMFLLACKNDAKNTDSDTMETTEATAETPHHDAEMNTEETAENTSETEATQEETQDEGFTYMVNYDADTELANDVDSTIKNLIANYPGMEEEFANAYGFAIFPKITKAGLGIGGAGGKGLVLENGQVIGLSKLMQATIGFQAGGQQYTQALFFENKEALDNFTNNKFKFSSEASAVALDAGATTDIVYHDGIATAVESEKGAMFEASLGTQKFKFEGQGN